MKFLVNWSEGDTKMMALIIVSAILLVIAALCVAISRFPAAVERF